MLLGDRQGLLADPLGLVGLPEAQRGQTEVVEGERDVAGIADGACGHEGVSQIAPRRLRVAAQGLEYTTNHTGDG